MNTQKEKYQFLQHQESLLTWSEKLMDRGEEISKKWGMFLSDTKNEISINRLERVTTKWETLLQKFEKTIENQEKSEKSGK